MWCLASTLAAPALAQAAKVADLRADDWQLRNRTARALAKAKAIDAAALLTVLQEEWDGSLPHYGRYGGGRYGNRKVTDPREKVLRAANTMLVGRWSSTLPTEMIEKAADIVAPTHPHDLALWVLQQHPDAANAPAFEPATAHLACAWLQLHEPDRAELQEAIDGKHGKPVAAGLWLAGESGRESLRALFGGASSQGQQAIAMLGRPELFDSPELIEQLTAHTLGHWSMNIRKLAGRVLMNVEDKKSVAAALAKACSGKPTAVQRALGLLCVLGADAAPAFEVLLAQTTAGLVERNRALVALASIEIPAEARAHAAKAMLETFAATNSTSTRLLLLDAIGNCGDGVDTEARKMLQQMLLAGEDEKLQARLLGCLQQLGAVPQLPTSRKEKIAHMPFAITTTWLALADNGLEGAKAILPRVPAPTPYVDKKAVLQRLMATAPGTVRKWLETGEPDVKTAVLRAMPVDRPIAGIDSKLVAGLIADEPKVATAAIDWLKARPDAARYAPLVFARSIELCVDHLPIACRNFAQTVKLPMPQKLDMLAPILKRGYGWEAVHGTDRPLLRKECRRWLAAETDGETRIRLLRQLCQAGPETDEDVRMILAAWSDASYRFMGALQDSPTLPDELRTAVEKVLTDDAAEDNMWSTVGWEAREVLRAHR